MSGLKRIIVGSIMLAGLYGFSGCDERASTEVIDKGSCPKLVLQEADDFSKFSFQKGEYTVEVTGAKYSSFGHFEGNLVIKEGEKTLYDDNAILSFGPKGLADFVNNHLFASTGNYFARDSNALEILLAPVSDKYAALEKKIEGD